MDLKCNDAAFISTCLFEKLQALTANDAKQAEIAKRLFDVFSEETVRLAQLEAT